MSNVLIGCDLAWKRTGSDWVLQHNRRRMGRVTPDQKHPGMYRVVLSRGRLSDMASLSWAKNAALVAAIRELQYEAKVGAASRATDPQKPQQIGGVFPPPSPLTHYSSIALSSASSSL